MSLRSDLMDDHPKKRMIHVFFGDFMQEYEIKEELNKWKENNQLFTTFKHSINRDFKINSEFAIIDQIDDNHINNINDLYHCYTGFEHNYNFVLKLQIKVSIYT